MPVVYEKTTCLDWEATRSSRKDGMKGMIGNKVIGIVAVFALLLIITVPVTAAEKTFELNIPGCSA